MTPGVVGFFVWFGIALVTVLLIWDMTRRIRRTRYRGELRERLERGQVEGAAPEPDDEVR